MRTIAFCLLLTALLGGQSPADQLRSAADQQTGRADCIVARPDSPLMVDKVTAPREVGPQPEGVPAAPSSNGSWSISLLGWAMLLAVGYRMRHTAQYARRVQLAVG